MKKHGLLKILGIVLLLVLVASFALPGSENTYNYIGLFDLGINSFKSLYYFFYMAIFILAIGGLYGVLNQTQRYRKLLNSIVTKVKPLGNKFIFITILLVAVIASVTGMTLPLLIFVPFIASIILLLGYDKLVAISATVVSILVGYIGGVFVTIYNPNTYGVETLETFVGTATKFDNMFPKLLLLLAGISILIFYVNQHLTQLKNKKVKYDLEAEEISISEVKGNYKNIKVWPIVVVLVALFVIVILGMVPWYSLFGITAFQDFHTWLTGLSIGEFAVFPSIFTKSLVPFGEWVSSGDSMTYMLLSLVIVIASIVSAIVGKLKFNEFIDSFVEGAKKVLPIAALVVLAYTILVCSFTNGFYTTIVENFGKFNYGISSLLILLGSLLHVDPYYVVMGVYTPILNLVTDETIYPSVAIMFQSLYGLFSIVGPTSIVLIFGLQYFNIPYTTWLKYIWRLFLLLCILIGLVLALVVLL